MVLDTALQAVAVCLTLYKTVTLCSIYVPLNSVLSLQELDALLDQLQSPYLLMGDFNGHNPLWWGTKGTQRVKGLRTLWPAMLYVY